MAFTINSTGATGIHMGKKNKTGFLPHTLHKNQPCGIRDLNMKSKIIKIL